MWLRCCRVVVCFLDHSGRLRSAGVGDSVDASAETEDRGVKRKILLTQRFDPWVNAVLPQVCLFCSFCKQTPTASVLSLPGIDGGVSTCTEGTENKRKVA